MPLHQVRNDRSKATTTVIKNMMLTTAVVSGEEKNCTFLHPEHAEPGFLGNRRLQRRGESQPQYITSLDGIDHTVIP